MATKTMRLKFDAPINVVKTDEANGVIDLTYDIDDDGCGKVKIEVENGARIGLTVDTGCPIPIDGDDGLPPMVG